MDEGRIREENVDLYYKHPKLEDFTDGDVLDFFISGEWKKLMVIGATDTGKSTFVRLIVDQLSKKYEVGVVDLDIGQSHIGPPTTVGWGTLKGGFRGWKSVKLKDFYFTGAISPVGNMLPVLVGSGIIVARAESLCGRVVIDTTGLVSEPHGRVLKQNKIELLKPDLLVLIQREGELEEIISPFINRSGMKIVRLVVPENAKLKTPENRSNYREKLFEGYFSESSIVDFHINNVGIMFTRNRIDLFSPYASGRVVSLRDRKGRDVALGILMFSDQLKSRIFIKTPLKTRESIATIVVGSINLDA